MRSMSNQFYNYIADQLLNYFKKMDIAPGERFYLQLDREQEISHLVKSLQQKQDTTKFIYKHEHGEPYDTFSIEIGYTRLVVAYTSKEVKPDFLVTLRNQVGEQTGVWNGTALLSIVSEHLDSIQGGSSDLQKEGMPLHPDSLYSTLKSEIEHSSLEKVDQIILFDYLENLIKEQAFQQITFFDFQEIYTILGKGFMAESDYKEFGLFKDTELPTYTGKQLDRRINENRELFDFIKKVHDFGLNNEELEKRFLSDFASKLNQITGKRFRFQRLLKNMKNTLIQKKHLKLSIKG